MTDSDERLDRFDAAPGEESPSDQEITRGVRTYLIGFGLAILLTVLSFSIPGTNLIWKPAIPVALVAFALAQMGVHLVFFLHITSAPDNTNNILALAFGTLIVFLVMAGSIWIMANLDRNMMPMDAATQMPHAGMM